MLGNELKRWLRDNQKTSGDLAGYLGVTERAVQYWLKDTYSPDKKTAMDLHRLTGIPLAVALGILQVSKKNRENRSAA